MSLHLFSPLKTITSADEQSSWADVRGSFTVSPSDCQLISGLNGGIIQRRFRAGAAGFLMRDRRRISFQVPEQV
jgi:hypothetical protein